jgi:phage shock protein E
MLGILKKMFGTPTDFKEMLTKGAIIIDVRSASEFRSGHIKNSRNIPLDEIKASISSLKKMNKPIITVCLSGGRSSMAQSILANAGIEAYNGGGWSQLNKKLQ